MLGGGPYRLTIGTNEAGLKQRCAEKAVISANGDNIAVRWGAEQELVHDFSQRSGLAGASIRAVVFMRSCQRRKAVNCRFQVQRPFSAGISPSSAMASSARPSPASKRDTQDGNWAGGMGRPK